MAQMRRATSDEQKQQRRAAILAVAWQLFQELPFAEITMSSVAEQAGLAKGTIYLYFTTKEELFLALQEQQFISWFDDLDTRLQALQGQQSIPQVATQVSDSLAQRPGMIRLLAMLHGVLEQNIAYETALRFKTMLLTRLSQTGGLLEGCLDFLPPGAGAQVLLRAYALMIGLYQLAEPTPLIRQVLAEPGLEPFVIDFATEFAASFSTLLLGMEHAAQQSGTKVPTAAPR